MAKGWKNLLRRLQMFYFLIWVVIISVFANVNFIKLSVFLRFVHFTIWKLCSVKKINKGEINDCP